MSLYKLTAIELNKLKSSRITLLLMLLAAAAPILGFDNLIYCSTVSENAYNILSPVKVGALISSILFSVYTIFEMDRIFRYNTVNIIETYTNMKVLNASKTLSLMFLAIVTVILSSIIFLPYTIIRLSYAFDLGLYAFSYFMIMLPAILFSVLISAGLYMLLRRMDASFLLYSTLVYISLNIKNNYLTVWLQTNVPTFSDFFGNSLAIRTVMWNRLLWLFISLSVFMVGILCTRKYGRNIVCSLITNSRKAYLPAVTSILLITAIITCLNEPYLDNTHDAKYELLSNKDSKSAVAKMVLERPDISSDIKEINASADITLNTSEAALDGKIVFSLDNIKEKAQEITLNLNPGYSVKSVIINGCPVSFIDSHKETVNEKLITLSIPESRKISMEIAYSGKLKINRLLQDSLSNTVISDEYISLSNSSLIPTLNVDTSGSVISGSITAPSHMTVITTGDRTKKVSEDSAKGTCTWSFLNKSSKIKMFASNYKCDNLKAGNMDIEFYYSSKQEPEIKSIDAKEIIKESIDYYTAILGQLGFKNIKIVDNSIFLPGGNASDNICNLGEGIFRKDTFSNSSYEGTKGVGVLAHEICHLWWGISTPIKDSSDSLWSAEGITVFSTYKFLQYKYGAEYANKECVESWKNGLQLRKRDFYYRHPEYMDVIPEKYLFSVLGAQNNTSMYAVMPLQIYRAEQLIGENKFKSILSKSFRRYKSGLGYDDFLRECNLTKEAISVE